MHKYDDNTKLDLREVVNGIMTSLRVGQQRNGGLIPAEARYISLLYNVQTGSGVHRGSCSVQTGSTFTRCKAAAA